MDDSRSSILDFQVVFSSDGIHPKPIFSAVTIQNFLKSDWKKEHASKRAPKGMCSMASLVLANGYQTNTSPKAWMFDFIRPKLGSTEKVAAFFGFSSRTQFRDSCLFGNGELIEFFYPGFWRLPVSFVSFLCCVFLPFVSSILKCHVLVCKFASSYSNHYFTLVHKKHQSTPLKKTTIQPCCPESHPLSLELLPDLWQHLSPPDPCLPA